MAPWPEVSSQEFGGAEEQVLYVSCEADCIV
jgi:hypothetical protein